VPIGTPAPIVWGGKYNGFVVQTQYGEVRGWFTPAATGEGGGAFETEIGSMTCRLGEIDW
jgi:hypothetical protein